MFCLLYKLVLELILFKAWKWHAQQGFHVNKDKRSEPNKNLRYGIYFNKISH